MEHYGLVHAGRGPLSLTHRVGSEGVAGSPFRGGVEVRGGGYLCPGMTEAGVSSGAVTDQGGVFPGFGATGGPRD